MIHRIPITGSSWVPPSPDQHPLNVEIAVHGRTSLEPSYVIRTNREWLSEISQYFEGVLTSLIQPEDEVTSDRVDINDHPDTGQPNTRNQSVIRLDLDDPLFFLKFYQSLFNNEVMTSTIDELYSFLYNADYFGIPDLSASIIRYIMTDFTAQDFERIYLKIRIGMPGLTTYFLTQIMTYPDPQKIKLLLLDDFLTLISDDRLNMSPEIMVFDLAASYISQHRDLSRFDQDEIFSRVRFPILYDQDRNRVLSSYPWMLPFFHGALTSGSRLQVLSQPPLYHHQNRPRMGVWKEISSNEVIQGVYDKTYPSRDLIVIVRDVIGDTIHFSGFPMSHVYIILSSELSGLIISILPSGFKYLKSGSLVKLSEIYQRLHGMEAGKITVLYPKIDENLFR